MQDFTNLANATSAQRKDSTESRIKRDASDLEKIRTKLEACSPFTSDPTLRNIVNGIHGIVAGQGENVPYFESVGNRIIDDIIGKSALTYKFKRIERARTLGNISAGKIAPDRTIDPALLNKPQLAQAIRDHVANLSSKDVMNSIPKTDCYVLDGGSLIHRLPWVKGDSYSAIAESYADLTVTHYGQARVVFDGYGECPSIKDEEMRKKPTPCC